MIVSFGLAATVGLALTLLLVGWILAVSAGILTRAPGHGPEVLPGLRPGELAPRYHTTDADQQPITLPVPGRPTLIVFADAGCGPCHELALNSMPSLSRSQAGSRRSC